MEDIKPKKERKFLKAVGKVAGILLQEFVLGLGRKFIGKKIDRIGNKRQALLIFLALFCNIAFASVDSIPYPITGNKQRLGWQTSGNGLVYRGRSADTITKPSSYVDKNVKAYLLVDSVLGTIFVWRQTYWDSIKVNTRLMPFDSITFNTAKNGTVGVGEVEYNDTQGSLIQGLKGGNVTNVIGQQLHQRVNNRTGATLNKGDVVYLSGSQGNRITVAKGLAVTDAFSANTFGVVAESIPDNQSGFIITEGLITGLNTSALTEDSAVYLSPTVAGALTSTKPQAPQHTVYIGVCVKSSNGSGELFIKIRNGQELDELHDTRITNPVTGATLYYSGGLWRDTTAALLVSDTASMLANYAKKSYVDTAGRFYARQDFSNVQSSTLTWTQTDTLIPAGVNVVQVYRNGQILLPSQYTIPTKTSIVIAATSYKIGENYTVIFPKGGGGASSGGGSGSLTSISAGTGITVSPNPITTTGTVSADLSVLMELTDTSLLNLTSRFATKLNTTDTASLSNRINAKGNGTVTSVGSGYGLLSTQSPITTSGVIRVDSNTVYNYVRDSIVKVRIGNDTIKILKQEYAPATTSILTWTVTPKFPIQLKQYILVFRNGQLLINDQYNLTDTNKITIVSNSFKVGANYTVVTVSGIGSVSTGTFPNPVYPDAGIALSTGTTWASSITNNSSNWNTAFTDRLKWDGGSSGLVAATGRTSLGGTTIGQSMFTLTNPSALTFPQFNADNTVTALSASSFRNAIGAGTVSSVTASSTAGNPLSITNTTTTPTIELLSATTGRNGYLTSTDWTTFNNKQSQINGTGFVKASGTSITYDNSTYLTTGTAASTYLPLTGGTLTGALSGTSGTFTSLNVNNSSQSIIALQPGDNNLASKIQFINFGTIRQEIIKPNSTGNLQFRSYPTGTATGGYEFYVSNGTAESLAATIGTDKSLSLTGTLGVTGATTLGSTLAVSGATTLSTTTATPTVLLGKDGSNVVGAITLGSGLTLSSGTLIASGATGVTSVTATSPLLSSGGSTPNITITDASTTTSGVITTGNQSIAGAKTFTSATVINGGLVVNEDGSSVGTFRVEGDNNTSLIQTLPASDYVGIGRVPENSFDVQGAVRFRTLTLNGTPTRIIGADATGDINQIALGSGLSLSSGTLSATNTGTVTNVTGTLPISVANGTTTPSITIANASTSASGVVTTGTQSFAGNKTFTGLVGMQKALQRPVETITNSSASVTTSSTWVIVNNAGTCTLTLPSAGSSTGTEFFIKTITNNAVVSASSNIVPLAGGSASTSILSASAGKWATLVSDGTNWVIMQAN